MIKRNPSQCRFVLRDQVSLESSSTRWEVCYIVEYRVKMLDRIVGEISHLSLMYYRLLTL